MADHLYADAAAELRVKESWLRERIGELPHIKYGGVRGKGTVTFTDAHLEQIRAMFEIDPTSTAAAARSVPNAFEADLRPVRSRRTA
jgi:hypothetical protein